jgi:radical SAM superfamily
MKRNVEYVDVENLTELPDIQIGKKYLKFLGGTKKYRCFIVDKNYSRYNFYKEYLDLIDKMLYPIYKNRGIVVAQDNIFPIPGFYIIFFDKQFRNITEIPESLMIRTCYIVQNIRKILFDKLNVKLASISCEEKNNELDNVYYRIIPKYEKLDFNFKIDEANIECYFNSFAFDKIRKKIIKYNTIIKKELEELDYKKTDDELYNKIELREKKINLCVAKHCFITCKGCYNRFCNKKEISYKKIISFLKYAKLNGLEKVTLSGGDPLTRKDIKKIIKKCNKLNLKINLDTVGLSLTKSRIIPSTKEKISKFSNINILKKVNSIGIPLDGSNNDVISKFRTYNGNLFNEIIDILELFDKKNIKICINTVLHKENLKDIENIYYIIRKYNCVKQWQIFQFMSIGPLGSKNAVFYDIKMDDFFKAKERVEKISKNSNIVINFKSAVERSYNYMLIDSTGVAYKVDLDNKIETFGKIDDRFTWDNIMNNLF